MLAIGNKGAQFVRRITGVDLQAAYPGFGDTPTANLLRPVLNTIVQQYKDGSVDEVVVLYTKFKSTVSQTASVQQILPAQPVAADTKSAPVAISNLRA